MRCSFFALSLSLLFHLTLCDTVYYEGTSSVTKSTSTPIIYYPPTTLISSTHATITEATTTDHFTPPSYSTYPPYLTNKPTTIYSTTYILPTSQPSTITKLTTYIPPTTTSSSTSITCVSPSFTWSGPTDIPTAIPTYGGYRMRKRADPPKLTPEQIELMRLLVQIYDQIEKAKPVIDEAIKLGNTGCQSFKDLVAIVGFVFAFFFLLQSIEKEGW
ncbi:ec661463-7750-4339-9bbc-3c61f82aa2d4 [Sclerotinia trifoliorum]|uniref:Ec661463-7750-4339-9bbc-3c61f82aa2d4 n=1 Tax=Sclerotinia trifoliorum TaxID=28548 RepID=A0A8H2ZNX5_9HELO|nr:ec661463-7750-4339-9bbc-3c61f82aa2d4 [Sclerotinia trifoliorum]